MSRQVSRKRREAAELAHALALSTQQARDICEISPHTLSPGLTGDTQDSRDFELKTVEMALMTGDASTEEVALFSSRHGDEARAQEEIDIQSFSAPSYPEPGVQICSDKDSQRANTSRPSSNFALAQSAQRHHSAREKFSPTQTSDRIATADQSATSSLQIVAQQRTPLRARENNRCFQLSSSPIPSPENGPKLPGVSTTITSSTTKPEPAVTWSPSSADCSAGRAKLYPEIVLPSTTRTSLRHESPDPLNSLPEPMGSASRAPRPSTEPFSASAASVHSASSRPPGSIESGRRSSRVQAAAEKKQAEKEERRRLRRERKAREEKEKSAASAAEQAKGRRDASSTASNATDTIDNHAKQSRLKPAKRSKIGHPQHQTPVDEARSPGDRQRADRFAGSRANQDDLLVKEAQVSTTHVTDLAQHMSAADRLLPVIDVGGHDVSETMEVLPTRGEVDVERHQVTSPATAPAERDEANDDALRAIRGDDALDEKQSMTVAVGTQPAGASKGEGSLARPNSIRWQTSRTDLSSVLAKFPGSRPTGMSKRHRIAPLHAKIGPPAKALPPVPQKPVRKKKGEESEESEEEESGSEANQGDGDSDEDSGKTKKGKGKGIEWFMVED